MPAQTTKRTSRTGLEKTQRMSTVIPGEKMREFEENLPANCFFRNETRTELPRDPVKLIKLKLVKQKTKENLAKEIKRVVDLSQSRQNRNQLFRMNQRIDNLEQTKQNREKQLDNIRQQFNRMRNSQHTNNSGKTNQIFHLNIT